MEQKTYVFHVSRGADKHERYELTEDQLEPKHRKLLLASLWKQWDNTPAEQQREFIEKRAQMAIDHFREKFTSELKSKFQEREDLDENIDSLIKAWRRSGKIETKTITSMIRLLEKKYPYVKVNIVDNLMEVSIHDGQQRFY